VCTTYGVGELSAINGIAGAYAVHTVFHLVGTPNISTQAARAPMHHTLGNGEYDLFRRMSEPVVCGHAVMTPQNVAYPAQFLCHSLNNFGNCTPNASAIRAMTNRLGFRFPRSIPPI
jgi:hypothetical protein